MENQTHYLDHSTTLDKWNHSLTEKLIPFTTILIVYLVLGVFGNSIVLYIYLKQFKSYGGGRYFIPFLAVFDMIACVTNCSGYLSETIAPLTAYKTDIGCQMRRFFCFWTSAVAVLTVLLIAIDRYLTICRPSGRQMTQMWKKWSIVIIMIVGALCAIPRTLTSGLTDLKFTDGVLIITKICSNGIYKADHADQALVQFVLVTSFIVAEIMTLSVLYFRIYKVIFRRPKKETYMADTTPSTITNNSAAVSAEDDQSPDGPAVVALDITANRHETTSCEDSSNTVSRVSQVTPRKIPHSRMVVIFIVKTITFSICFIPKYGIRSIMRSNLLEFIVKRPDLIYVTCFVDSFFICNYIINPVIYGCLDRKFQAEVKKMFCSVTNRIRRII